MRQSLLIALFLAVAQASIFCPHTAYPSTGNSDEFVVASIQTRQRPSQESYYRITDDTSDPAFKRNSSRFRLMTTRDSTECPFRGCLVELSPVEPKNHGTLLYQTSVIGKMIPPGFFAMDISRRFYCVVTDNDCGATIPLYRHYRLTTTGIYHAYSLEADDIIDGYIREGTPLCYVWPKDRPELPSSAPSESSSTLLPPLTDIFKKLLPKPLTTPSTMVAEKISESSHSNEDNALIDSDDLCEEADRKTFDSSMKKLKEYYNGETGAKSDHWYSTQKPKGGYKPKAFMGKIITDPKTTNCKCLVQLQQMKYESADKNVLDHKLVRVQMEPLSLYQYMPTGEELYCAPRENACGATVPLRKFYNLGDSDSTMTVNSDLPPLNSGPSPAVLCWIWPKNYHQDSTEEELRKENMNVIQPSKSGEKSVESVEGSGVEPIQEKKLEKAASIKAEDAPKPEKKSETKPAPKKSKKKSKKRGNKKPKTEKSKTTTEAPKIESTTKSSSIEEESQLGGDQILRFEAVDDADKKVRSIFAPIESEEKSEEKAKSEDKSLLDEDEEKVKELAKFQNNKRGGKEPTEIEEQQDGDYTVLPFENFAPKL